MFRVPLLIAVALVIAFGGGILTTLSALNASSGFGAIKLGVWSAFPAAQTVDADPYAKSHRAKAGRLLYGSAEGLTFTAATDEDGNQLTGTCSYRIVGRTPAARLWTLYAANPEGEPLPARADLPFAHHSQSILRNQDGTFEIAVSPTARPMNWLALPDTGAFTLVLTLLDTPAAGSSGLIGLEMPRVESLGCGQ
ncbi:MULTISPECIES: DUF1214 domain-containing protein [Alphaproteobacteria]|uniref:Membrane protein n=2 Tax=Alphaproteobacteria TaxID=28211 RepID=A0A512HFW4_9HYPH|nr:MULTISPECIES: DUF1214 domain-containing protein [Alphaproteobacteria]GEO84342.1 membrane protein [Ciceribacter naphthalenivorans]GLR24879.1 membrane protein [Ciceribacter naphthalenivorans]GLT07735.1 membrane protein [Sphingomonas psychrolutea]